MGIIENGIRFLLGKKQKIRGNTWVFGEWMGERCCDNCLFLANYIVENHPGISCAWIAKKETDLSLLDPRIKRIEMGTLEAKKAIEEAFVIIVNQGAADVTGNRMSFLFGSREVNLWHGMPWKRIGFSALKDQYSLPKALIWRLMVSKSTDGWLSLNPSMTEIIAKEFHAKQEKIITAGYPRNSLFYQTDNYPKMRERLFSRLGLMDDANNPIRIITYMPTFRDNRKKNFSFLEIIEDDRFQKLLETYNAVVIQKVHFAAREKALDGKTGRIFTENAYPAQLLLAATDLLISDYSSCFFDFLITDRPIIHYIYDYDEFRLKDRGLYFSKEEAACGDTPETLDDLLENIRINLEHPEKNVEIRQRQRGRFLTFESEDSCEKIFQMIKGQADK